MSPKRLLHVCIRASATPFKPPASVPLSPRLVNHWTCARSQVYNNVKHGYSTQTPAASYLVKLHRRSRGRPSSSSFWSFCAVAAGLVGAHLLAFQREVIAEAPDKERELRFIRLDEVKKHGGTSERPWVIKGDCVYDITDWVGAHPGGEIILRAAGNRIEPYWDIFSMHKTQYVYDILEQYLVGKIHPEDLIDGHVPPTTVDDPFSNEPERDPRLHTLTARPRCAETPSDSLAHFLTPNDTFYVRNHMWVPTVEEAEYRLTVELQDGEERSYSLQELKERFPRHKITATLQCAGNRRKDMTEHARKTNGLQWTVGAISTAEWEGVKLLDVLADAGLDVKRPPPGAEHTHFVGHEAYGASIPIEKALDSRGDVLLAFNMNGKSLPPDHGFPLRVVVPGNVAARSVKWLKKIVVSDEESPSQWQQKDYKCFGPNVANPDWSKGKSIQEMPVTSAITGIAIREDEERKCDVVELKGYAFSGGGREIVRVDISLDNGNTWDQAELTLDEGKGSRAWCWKQWKYDGAEVPKGSATFLVKATDEAYNTQPETHSSIYNPRGNLATAWHRVAWESYVNTPRPE